LDDSRFKFAWPECVGESGLDCENRVRLEISNNIVENVQVKLVPEEEKIGSPDSTNVVILVNRFNYVLGQEFDGIVANDQRAFNCLGSTFVQCCRKIERALGQEKHLQCQKTVVQPMATVHQGLQDKVSYSEHIYNSQTHQIELDYVDPPPPMTVEVIVNPDSNKVVGVPRLNALLQLNPVSFDGNNLASMSLSPEFKFLPPHLGDVWWYSTPFLVTMTTLCSCCGLFYFMCCIPVEPYGDDESDMIDRSKEIEVLESEIFGHSQRYLEPWEELPVHKIV